MAEVGAQSPEFHQDVERVLGAAIAAAEGGEPAAARVLHDAGFRLSSDPEVHDFLVRLRALYQAEHRRQSA
jgi:hypothetical protein